MPHSPGLRVGFLNSCFDLYFDFSVLTFCFALGLEVQVGCPNVGFTCEGLILFHDSVFEGCVF